MIMLCRLGDEKWHAENRLKLKRPWNGHSKIDTQVASLITRIKIGKK